MEECKEYEELTAEVVKEYHQVALELPDYGHDIREQRKLKNELCAVYGVTEIEAINILIGRNVKDYIIKYGELKKKAKAKKKAEAKENDVE